MLNEQTFYGLESWKCYKSEHVSPVSIKIFQEEQILKENELNYIVLFVESKLNEEEVTIECYKKHATSILKSILIGKFPLPVFNDFKKEIDRIHKQSTILEQAIDKPEFIKYKFQKKLYFNLN